MAGKGNELTFWERKEIESFLKIGKTSGFIASTLGRAHACIKQEVKKNGGRAVYNAEEAQKSANARKIARSLKISKGVTPQEEQMIRESVSRRWSLNRIAKEVGMSDWRIKKFLRGNHIKWASRSYLAFEERITALEEQVKFLSELIKESR